MYWIAISKWPEDTFLLGVIHQNNIEKFVKDYLLFHKSMRLEPEIDTINYKSWVGGNSSANNVVLSLSLIDRDINLIGAAVEVPKSLRTSMEQFRLPRCLEQTFISHRHESVAAISKPSDFPDAYES